MSGNTSSVEHLSVVITTDTVADDTQTATNSVTLSSSSGIEFYLQCAVVVIGVVGTAANALILYAMAASKQHKKHALIFNQNALDLFSCLFLATTYALKLCNIYLTGLGGYWFCIMLLSEHMIWCGILASKLNLVFVTIERYLKVVHAVWSKKKLRNWMVYAAVALAWLSGFVVDTALVHGTSDVIDGVCHAYVIWKSRVSQMAFGMWYFFFFFLVFLFLPRHSTLDLHLLLLAYHDRHPSSGKNDGRPQWSSVKHHSSRVTSDSV